MPPKKNVPIPPAKPAVSSPTELEAIRKYLAQKPDFESLIAEAKQHSSQHRDGTVRADNHTVQQADAGTTETSEEEAKAQDTSLPTATMSDTPKQDGSARTFSLPLPSSQTRKLLATMISTLISS